MRKLNQFLLYFKMRRHVGPGLKRFNNSSVTETCGKNCSNSKNYFCHQFPACTTGFMNTVYNYARY